MTITRARAPRHARLHRRSYTNLQRRWNAIHGSRALHYAVHLGDHLALIYIVIEPVVAAISEYRAVFGLRSTCSRTPSRPARNIERQFAVEILLRQDTWETTSGLTCHRSCRSVTRLCVGPPAATKQNDDKPRGRSRARVPAPSHRGSNSLAIIEGIADRQCRQSGNRRQMESHLHKMHVIPR